MADLDTTNQGEIYYRESNDVGVLVRATADIQLAFPTTASDFDAESVFIVTWHGVEGRSIDRSVSSSETRSIGKKQLAYCVVFVLLWQETFKVIRCRRLCS